MTKPMTSNRSYLLRALREWILDNALTPFMVVDATMNGVSVPSGYAENGRVILNMSEQAALNLSITPEVVKFSASFNGMPSIVSVPMNAVLAIYAKENGQGLVFPEEASDDAAAFADLEPSEFDRPTLVAQAPISSADSNPEQADAMENDRDQDGQQHPDDDDKGGDQGGQPRGRDHLKIIK